MLVNIGKVTKPSEQKQYTNIGRVSDEAQKRISGMNIKLPTLKEMFDNPQQSFSEAAKGNPIPSVYPSKPLIDISNQQTVSDSDIVEYFLSTQYKSEKQRLQNEKSRLEKQFNSSGFITPAAAQKIDSMSAYAAGRNKNGSAKVSAVKQNNDVMLEKAELQDKISQKNKELEALNKIAAAQAAGKSDKELLTLWNSYLSLTQNNSLKQQAENEIKKQRTAQAVSQNRSDNDPIYSVNKSISEAAEKINPFKIVREGVSRQNRADELSAQAARAAEVIPYFEDFEAVSGGADIELDLPYASDMTETEKRIFNYIRNTQGISAAKKYYTDLVRTELEDRHYEKVMQEAYNFGQEHKLLGSAASVASNLYGAAEQAANSLIYLFSGGEYKMPENWGAGLTGQLRGAVTDDIDLKIGDWDAFDFIYNTGMSAADTLTAAAIGGPAPGLSASLLGLSAAASASNDIIERGGTNEQAFWGGLAAGTFETLFEKISLGNLNSLKEVPANTFKDAIKNRSKSMLVNASEESATEIANTAYDTFVNADISQYKQLLTQYMQSGLSEQEAKNKAAASLALQVIEAGASGALMGAGFSGYYSARNAVRGNQQLKSVVKRLSEGEEVSADEIESVPKIAAALEKSRNAEETYSINTQERQELRDEAAEKLLNMGSYSGVDSSGKDAYNNDIRQERRIDIVIGPPAAGKSSVLVNPLSERHGSRVIDSDMAKELLPEFEGGVGASAVHRESQNIIKDVISEAVSNGENIVYPIVGGGDVQKLINRIRFFKNAGYSVHLHLNELDINKALGRAISRFTETGRFIPPQVILDYRDTPTRNFEAIKNMEGLLDGYSHYSNDVERGQSPILIEQQNEGLQLLHGRGQLGYGRSNGNRSKTRSRTGSQTSAEGSTEEQEVNEADFTESAFLAPEAENEAELPDGVRSETVTLTRDGKRRRHLNRAEQEYVKKIAGLFGVDVVFENVREKTGIAADSYYDGGNNIHMDFSVADPLNILIKHELTHFGEESREYNDFVRLVKDSKVFRDWINSKISGEKNISAKSAQYRQQIMDRYENAGEKLTVTGADGEMTANFVADTLFTDNGSGLDALIRQAEPKDRPVLIQWVIDFVKSVKSLFKGQYVPPEVLRLERKYVQMLKDAQSTEGQKNTAENGGEKFSINSDFAEQYDKWDKKRGNRSFIIGNTSDVLKSLGVRASDISWDASKILKIKRNHPAMTDEVIKQVPNILENPVLVMKSKTVDGRLTLFGEVYDSNNAPVLAVLELNPTSAKGKELNLIKVASAYGKDVALQNFINTSEIVYTDKKRIGNWLKLNRLKLPLVNRTDSINSISENSENVNSNKNKFSISEDQASLLDRYDRGEISRQEYLEESNKNWQRAVEEYGTIPEGEAPYDNIPVPTAVEDGRETKRFVRTVIEGGVLPKRMIEDLGSEILAGNMSYEPVSDKSAQEYADKQMNTGQAEQKWNDTVNKKSIITKDDIAVGEKLLIKAIKEHDTKRVLELTAELSDIFTRAGQTVQAASMFKKMTGMGKLVAVQRFVNSLNNDLEQKYGKKAPVLRIDETLAEQLTQIPQGEDPQNIYTEVIKDIASQVPVTFLEKLNAWRYLAMLFNPKTHIRNIVGNGIFIPSVRIKDYVAAALESAFVKNGERTKSIVIDKKYKDFADKMLKDNLVKQSLKEGRKTDELQLAEYRRIFKTEFLEKARQLNFGALEAEDFFFKTRHFRHALAGYLQANKADLNNIDSGLLARAQEYAIKEAAKATFNDASEIANAISKFAGKNKATDVLINGILPFKRTPINIVKRGIEYSPIGLTATIIKGSLDLKNGKITAAEYIDGLGAGISGSVVFALGALLASLGMATGGFGSDDEDKFKKLNGEQEYSLVIGGKSYTVDWAVPAAIPFFIGVETFNSLFDDNEDFTLSDITEVMWNSLEPITNLSMLSGVQDMISSVQYAAENRSIQSIAGAAVSSYISQFVPSIFGAVSRTVDDTRYSSYTDKNSQLSSFTQGIINSIRAKLPNVISKRPAYIDEWGRTESTGSVIERLFSNFISPGYFSEEQYTALDNEIQRLADSTGENSVYPGYAPKSFEVNGETKYLTAEEYQQYATAKGQYSLQYISEFMSSAAYNRLNDGERVSVIENLYKYANAKAKAEVSDYDITKSFKTVSQWEKSGRSPVIYYISLAIK